MHTPTLVIGGGPTSTASQPLLAEFAAALPAARLVTIPVGHHVHRVTPEEFVAAVDRFLA